MKTRRKIRGSCFADDSVAQWIERLPPEQKVASSSLVGITERMRDALPSRRVSVSYMPTS